MSIDTEIPLWLSLAFIVGGLYVLAKSADLFVDSAGKLARGFGISPMIVGMVVIGFGTSAPELAVSAISASGGHPGLSLGNAYGSCIFNIAAILGLVALFKPIKVKPSVNAFAVPLLAAVTLVSAFLLRNNTVSRSEALILLSLFAVVLPVYCWYDQPNAGPGGTVPRKSLPEAAGNVPMLRETLRAAAGLVLLVSSSHVLVWGSVDFARDVIGASDLLIGLTVVAIGTSLPELASAVASARKGENEFVIGNIVGSNLFNTLAVVGIAGTISPFGDFSRFIILRDLPVMLALTLSIALFGVNFRRPSLPGRIGRVKGALWLAAMLAYTAVMAMQELASR